MLSRIVRPLMLIHRNGVQRMIPRTICSQESQKYQLHNQQLNQETPKSLRLSSCEKFLVLNEPKNELVESKFPLVWLRDNCQCSQCFHPEVNRRILDWTTFEFNQKLKSYKLNESEETVTLNWEDGHESIFPLHYFKSHKFDKETSEKYLRTEYRLPKIPWSKNDSDFKMPRYSLEEIMFNSDGKEMKRWLTGLCQNGMAILENPIRKSRPDLMKKFIQAMFGFCKETHYGGEFLVQNRVSDITNVAYLNGNLQLHTDLPYYDYVPGVTVLHYLKQSREGGKSTLADGFQIAERIRKEDPEAFEILSTLPVNWVDKGVENGLKFHKIFRKPVIGLKDGQLDRINHSVPQRDSIFSVDDPKKVQKWFEAMELFKKFSKEEVVEFKMDEDDFLTFDNTRLLHGRTAFEANEHRTIVGCYVDWDEIYSKYRANDN